MVELLSDIGVIAFLEKHGSKNIELPLEEPFLYVLHNESVERIRDSRDISVNLARIRYVDSFTQSNAYPDDPRKIQFFPHGNIDLYRVTKDSVDRVDLPLRDKVYHINKHQIYTTIDHIVVPS